ncbi:MAG: 4-(cytidine 5'-diphospho)-2-C-methyl-D-erythritol kinase [Trueperaceae bacterium]|nr:4-(cytidine 5'-diphospho)-2-C-methyl-D-erythritol kinase [Trueperaceae bacterium]
MRAPEARRLIAPAKVNLGLRVAAKRGDGYHEIDTVFLALDLHDDVQVTRTDGPGIDGEVQNDPPGAHGAVPGMHDGNLAYRAAEAWLRATGHDAGVRIVLRKRIPVAAGLGGGSSDAGAVLRALAEILPGEAKATDVAREVGSDVPFFAAGLPAARGRGRGERLAEMALTPRDLVLVHPGVRVSAADAYAALSSFGPPTDAEGLRWAWNAGEVPRWRNDLQAAVARLQPGVRDVLRALLEVELQAPLLSGSGATCFALARDGAHARDAAAVIEEAHPGWWCAPARGPVEAAALVPRPVNIEEDGTPPSP